MTIAIIIIGGAAILIIALICAVAFISGIEKGYNMTDKEYEKEQKMRSKHSKKNSCLDDEYAPDIESFHINDISKLTYL